MATTTLTSKQVNQLKYGMGWPSFAAGVYDILREASEAAYTGRTDADLSKWGTDGDFTMGFDGTNFEVLPAVDQTGEFHFGDGTTDCDVKVFCGDTSNYVFMDAARTTGMLETKTVESTDLATGAYAGIYSTYTITASQTNNTSQFAVWGELYMTGDLRHHTNSAALWGHVELTDGGGSLYLSTSGDADDPMSFTAGVAASVMASDGLVVETGSVLCGLRSDSQVHASATLNGHLVGLEIDKGSGKLAFEYGVRILANAADYGLYFLDVEHAYYINSDMGTLSGEEHCEDLVVAGTLASGASMVGKNIAVTTAGTAGSWVSALYAKVTQGATKNVNGYISAAEFEVINTAPNVSDWFVLVLNANSSYLGSHTAFIALRDYGSDKVENLFWAPESTIATKDSAALVSTTADKVVTHCVKFIAGTTTLWLLASSDAPED